jgi:hypothetical protein
VGLDGLDHVGVEHPCPPSSSFEKGERHPHRSPLGPLACWHDPSEGLKRMHKMGVKD